MRWPPLALPPPPPTAAVAAAAPPAFLPLAMVVTPPTPVPPPLMLSASMRNTSHPGLSEQQQRAYAVRSDAASAASAAALAGAGAVGGRVAGGIPVVNGRVLLQEEGGRGQLMSSPASGWQGRDRPMGEDAERVQDARGLVRFSCARACLLYGKGVGIFIKSCACCS